VAKKAKGPQSTKGKSAGKKGGNPPEDTRFQPGSSGNPKGRPKGSKNLSTLLMDAARDQVNATIGGRKRNISKIQATTMQLATKAAGGDNAAIARFLDWIDALRDGDPSYLDPRTIAMRLIALLPNRNGTKNQSQNTPHSISATINSRPWWAYVISMCFVLGAQFMIANKQLPAKADGAQAETSNPVSPQIPPERSGQ
jgi:Family of unknown function (DUF5681)